MTLQEFKSTPIGSLLLLPPDERQGWLEIFFKVPTTLRSVASSLQTGAYIRGLAKTYQLAEDESPRIAFVILRIILGELPLRDLGGYLSSELKIANDKAQKMAQELEHDLFAPVAGELSQYLAAKKQAGAAAATASAREAGATNILDLKQEKPPAPPPIPPPPKPLLPKPLPPRPPVIPRRESGSY